MIKVQHSPLFFDGYCFAYADSEVDCSRAKRCTLATDGACFFFRGEPIASVVTDKPLSESRQPPGQSVN